MDHRLFDAIIFDLGNTLIYFDGSWPEVFADAEIAMINCLSSSGLTLDEKSFTQEFHRRMMDYYRERETEFIEYTTLYVLRTLLNDFGFKDTPENLIRSSLAAFYAITQAHWKTETDAIPTLRWLRTAEYRLGLVSNAGDDSDIQVLVDQAGLRTYFDYIVSSAAAGIRKPNPRIFQLLIDRWGLPANRVAMVGDTLGADILGAHNAGIFSIWITRRADTPDNHAHVDMIRPDSCIKTLSELPELLKSIGG